MAYKIKKQKYKIGKLKDKWLIYKEMNPSNTYSKTGIEAIKLLKSKKEALSLLRYINEYE